MSQSALFFSNYCIELLAVNAGDGLAPECRIRASMRLTGALARDLATWGKNNLQLPPNFDQRLLPREAWNARTPPKRMSVRWFSQAPDGAKCHSSHLKDLRPCPYSFMGEWAGACPRSQSDSVVIGMGVPRQEAYMGGQDDGPLPPAEHNPRA